MSELIQTHLQDRVLTVRLNRADKKNAVTMAMYSTMAEAVKGATDKALIVLRGAGDRAFSSGFDLGVRADTDDTTGAIRRRPHFLILSRRPGFAFLFRLSPFFKRITAMIANR